MSWTRRSNLDQQELQLKNLISRTGLADPELAARASFRSTTSTSPLRTICRRFRIWCKRRWRNAATWLRRGRTKKHPRFPLWARATGFCRRSEVFGGESLAGLAGAPHTVSFDGFTVETDSYFVGGMGNALGQIFRRNFPTQRIGGFIAAPLDNRQAQADFGIDQLQLRQTQLENQKNANQAGVDVLNSVIALRQARTRYESALKNRELDQQLLDAEQKKLSLGASIPYNVIQQQRDLTASQSSVIAAEVSYINAKVALDQTLGTILETNHVSIAEARSGRVDRASAPPAGR